MTLTTEPVRPAAGEDGLAGTVRRLAAAQKGANGAPAYSRFVNRPLGRVLAALAFHARLTPNAVTGLSAVATAAGIAMLALGPWSWATGVAVTACLLLGYALDSADGQLARLRGGGSPAGEWLDHMVDVVKMSSLHLAVLIGLYRSDAVDDAALMLIPLAFCVVDSALYFAAMLNESLRARHGARTRAESGGRAPSLTRSLLGLPNDYGFVCLVFLLLGAPTAFLSAYAVLFLAAAGYLALGSITWFREMTRLPR